MILWVESGDTIADVKEKLLEAMGFIFTSPRDIRLVSAVRDLEDDRTLGDYNIQSGACLWMLKRLRGGMDGGFDDDEADFLVWPSRVATNCIEHIFKCGFASTLEIFPSVSLPHT